MIENQDMLRKIQALLAKAEATDHPEEAETFYAKAAELMTRHAIDEEMLRRAKPKEQRQQVIVERFQYSETGRMRMAKVTLLHSIAMENRCQVVLIGGRKQEGPQECWIAGFPDDISFVKMLYASLSITVMREGNRQFNRGSGSFSNFIRNFHDGFTLAIRKRLAEQNKAVEKDVGETRALVLYDRKREVADAVAQKFGRLKATSTTGKKAYDDAARSSGYQSGMSANLRPGEGQLNGGRKLIGN